MSIAKKSPGESGPEYIARKYIEYRKKLDDALEAGALSSPILSEVVEPTKDGGFTSVIRISFTILEYKLHQFKNKPQ